jgi:hypothetical protein
MIIAQIGLFLAIGLFVGFFAAMFIAGIMDWNYRRKNRLWIELQRDHTKQRRPAAK